MNTFFVSYKLVIYPGIDNMTLLVCFFLRIKGVPAWSCGMVFAQHVRNREFKTHHKRQGIVIKNGCPYPLPFLHSSALNIIRRQNFFLLPCLGTKIQDTKYFIVSFMVYMNMKHDIYIFTQGWFPSGTEPKQHLFSYI